MNRRLLPLVCLSLAWGAAALAAAPGKGQPAAPTSHAATHAATPAAAPRRPGRDFINGTRDSGQYLPDSTVLARVDDKVIRASDYVDHYFSSYAEFRPRPDSAGRVEFLNSMVNKEIMGRVARAANRPLTFEDRAALREHTNRVLSNVLYQRAVIESTRVDDARVAETYEQFKFQVHLQHILFADPRTAERVRVDLIAGRIAWKDAVTKYSQALKDRGPEGELGWTVRMGFDPVLGEVVFALRPGEISKPIETPDGYEVMRCAERRAVEPPAFEAVKSKIRDDLRRIQVSTRSQRLQDALIAEIGMTYDSANVVWASSQFQAPMKMDNPQSGIEINAAVPEFTPEDTARVLARWKDGSLSLSTFLNAYSSIQPMLRPAVNSPELFRHFVNSTILEPYQAQLAVKRGLDKDPLSVALIDNRREEIIVEHMYDDSITSRVWVSPAQRKAYYEKHKTDFITYPRVRYAAMYREARGAADSLANLLRAGGSPESVLRADSVAGLMRGSIQERGQNEHGPYQKVLFEELRPGQVTVEGPDKEGHFLVIQLITFDPGHQLSFAEADNFIAESLQNQESEARLKAFLARHKRGFHIESHPELVMRVKLVDRADFF